MSARFRQRGQALILLATWLLVGGSAASALVVYDRPASEIKKAVKRVLPEDERRKEILDDIDNWASTQKQRDKDVAKGRDELLKALRRQDARRGGAEPVMAGLDQQFEAMDRDFLDLRFRLKERVSAAEWAQLLAR